MFAAIQSAHAQGRPESVSIPLACLNEVFTHLNPLRNEHPDAVRRAGTLVFATHWHTLVALMQTLKRESTMELLCQCFKFYIRQCFPFSGELLPPIMLLLTEQYQRLPRAAFLYLIAICVGDFGRLPVAPPHQSMFEQTLLTVTTQTFATLPTLAAFNEHPDVVDDYFEMLTRYTLSRPDIIYQQWILPNLFAHGLLGLALTDQKRAVRSCLGFFFHLIESALRREQPQDVLHCEVFVSVLQLHGPAFFQALVRGIAGVLPRSSLKWIILVWKLLIPFCASRPALPCHQWTHAAVSALDVDHTQKELFFQQLFGSISQTSEYEKMIERAVKGLSQACREVHAQPQPSQSQPRQER
jgi:hypothetical protein